MELSAIFERDLCLFDLTAPNKEEVLQAIARTAVKSRHAQHLSADLIYQKLAAREAEGSTGFGNGIAIPHARIEGLTEFILFIVTSRKGVEFGALDKKKVNIIFVVLGPQKEVGQHLKILAAVSRIIAHSNVKREILEASSAMAVYESFLRHTRIGEAVKTEKAKMKLLVVILYFDEYLYQVLEFFIQAGVEGATILESAGMGDYISNIPIFAEFIGFLKENKNRSRTILALVPEQRIGEIIDGIEDITGDLDKKEGATILSLDVSAYKGSMKMI